MHRYASSANFSYRQLVFGRPGLLPGPLVFKQVLVLVRYLLAQFFL
jgi:hypothetical protein